MGGHCSGHMGRSDGRQATPAQQRPCAACGAAAGCSRCSSPAAGSCKRVTQCWVGHLVLLEQQRLLHSRVDLECSLHMPCSSGLYLTSFWACFAYSITSPTRNCFEPRCSNRSTALTWWSSGCRAPGGHPAARAPHRNPCRWRTPPPAQPGGELLPGPPPLQGGCLLTRPRCRMRWCVLLAVAVAAASAWPAAEPLPA